MSHSSVRGSAARRPIESAKSMPELPSAAPPQGPLGQNPNPGRSIDMSPNSRSSMEMAQKKRREKDNESHLIAQIKALNKQLEQERLRKVEEDAVLEAAAPKSRLIIVANRLPVTPRRARDGEWRFDRSSGGLVSAFLGVKNMEITWVGWVGVPVPENEQETVADRLYNQTPFPCVPVFLDPEVADNFYNGFCNNVLWPLLHYIPLSMLDSQASVAELQWQAYQVANEAFCDAVLSLKLSDSDLIWVQDYHLMLLPKMLRERAPQMAIGWFLHTPFATSEMYRTLPHREEILRGVLGADLVGFHIYDYARHFHTASSRVLGTGGAEGVTEGNEGIFDHATRRSIAVDAFPIGIEPSKFEACLEQPVVKDKIIDLQRRFDGKKVLLGIDRLDYVKGIPHKLKAIECFLRAHPSWRGKVVLLQIAVPSRSEVPGYQKLRNNVHKQVGRINGEFGSIDNVPIHYLDQSMSFQELCALYYRADIMFVTSLRDGMNLVSFEFIACQREKCGVLVLSEFAGAAQALGAGALLVNPYNTDEVASALHEALNMSMSEREQRFDYLSTHINQHTAQTWAEKFVGSLRHARQASNYDSGPFSGLEESSELPHREVIASYKACERVGGRRLLVFGLLGTLIDYARFVNLEHLMPSVRRNLAEIAASPQNTVIVCSGRERALMNEWLGDLPIWLVAENGLWLRPPMGAAEMEPPEWEQMKEDIDGSWMAALKPIFRYFEARTPEAFTEVQEYTMTWHFQDSDEDFAEVQAGDLQAHLVKVSGHVPVEVSLDVKRVEVRPYGISKGAAIATILERLQAEAEAEAAAEAVAILEGDEDLSQPWQAGVGGADGQPPPPQQQQHPPKTPPRQDGATRGAGGSRTGSLEEVDVGDHSAAAHAAVAAVGLAHRTSSSGQLSDESGTSPGSPGVTPKSLFGWVFCAGQTLSRDEDMFSNLQALTKDDEGNDLTEAGSCPRVFTCCVGKTLSQAEFRMEDCSEVAGLLDLLANVSADEQPVADENTRKQLPLPSSCLERLKELQRELEGKQLLLILDFEGCAQAVANPSPAMARVLKRYPAAVVQRTPWNAPTADPTESSERDLRSSGLGLSSKDLFDMEQRAREREEGITKADLFSTNPSTAAAALEALGSISGVQIVSYGAHGFGMGGSGERVETGEMVVEKGVDSYRPALESCLLVLQARFGENSQITIEDNTFSLTVSHRGVEDEVAEDTRLAVNTLLEEDYPMLRSDEERTQIHVRPDPGWTRARMVEWIATQVVDAVEEKLRIKNKHRAMPIYLGEDPSFRHLNAISGLEIVITSGPGIDGYYLRHARQVDELLDWLAEQHAAGITVRGGKIKYPKLPGGVPLAAGSGSAIAGTQRQAHVVAAPGAAKGKRVQISLPN